MPAKFSSIIPNVTLLLIVDFHSIYTYILGNAVVVKPSELSVHTSNLLATLIPKYLDQVNYILVQTLATILCRHS